MVVRDREPQAGRTGAARLPDPRRDDHRGPRPGGVGGAADLLLRDLLRNTQSSQTFRLFAAPDASAGKLDDGTVFVELKGVDLYDAAKGEASARSREDVAAWFLDHDYDGEVFHVCQAFFPKTSGWASLARALQGSLDEDALEQLATFQSNAFTAGEHQRAAVRVVAFAGQTSETVIPLP